MPQGTRPKGGKSARPRISCSKDRPAINRSGAGGVKKSGNGALALKFDGTEGLGLRKHEQTGNRQDKEEGQTAGNPALPGDRLKKPR